MRILLTGATGYIGGRLLKKLKENGHKVRCIARRPEMLTGRLGNAIQAVAGDLLLPETLAAALDDVEAVYYLVHSMGARSGFEEKDRQAAHNLGQAALRAGVKRIIYLGGLGDSRLELSPHLRSRQEVGRVLKESGVPTIEFRASIILGSGSLSFELIRALVERLPIMITPRWVGVKAQPIHVNDVIEYLLGALTLPLSESLIIEIGGPDQCSYGEIMREYACQRNLRRLIIPVPLLTPYLSSLWLGLVTPVYAHIGRMLIDGLRYPTVVQNTAARDLFALEPAGLKEAIALSLRNEDEEYAATRWSDALSSSEFAAAGGRRFGNRIVDTTVIKVDASPEEAFAPLVRIGGSRGWFYGTWLFVLAGFVDKCLGGVGAARGRRDPDRLHAGDPVDCWRVEQIEAPRYLRLVMEMRIPGRAWLEFAITPAGEQTEIRQIAIFDPLGLTGIIWWYGLYPLHRFVFIRRLESIGRAARELSEAVR